MKVFTPEQMRAFDKSASEKYQIPSIVLMENAALRVVEWLEAKCAPLSEKRITILCGKGNNGGDGFAIARQLLNCGARVQVLAEEIKRGGDAKINAQIWQNCGETVSDPAQLKLDFRRGDIVIDALLGTGFHGEVRGDWLERAFDVLLSARSQDAKIIAIDVPSGLNAATGEAAGMCVDADVTISFAAPKRGFFVRDGLAKCGEIWIGDIGSAPAQMQESNTNCALITRDWARAHRPQRSEDAHKGDAGRALIIGGSRGMSGAVALASRAALHSGVGLCLAAVPDAILDTFAASILEATSTPLPCDRDGALLPEALATLRDKWEPMQVVALGPGVGRSDKTQELIHQIVRECPQPLIIDADALHALPKIATEVKARKAPTILTPHPGEMGTLMNISAHEVNEKRYEIAAQCAEKYGAIVVLKGARSIVALPKIALSECENKSSLWVNLTGNAGMATGGSGDALTGTIAGILAQLKDAETATIFSVYLHGLAGDIAAHTRGNGLTAGNIVDSLPPALLELERESSPTMINYRLHLLA